MTGTADFDVLEPPSWSAAALFNSPHSGRAYGRAFLAQTRLSAATLRKSEDCYIDELFDGCLAHGAGLLRVHVPRCYIDLNREPFELDPRLFLEPLPAYANASSPRVAGGLGTIPRVVAEGEDIYRQRLPIAEGLRRIEAVYRPYHRALSDLLDRLHDRHGAVLLIDCHSMPSSAANHLPGKGAKADVVLGDRFGVSCAEEISLHAEALFRAAGLAVHRNRPYAGGFITQNYSAPRAGRHALQIELNRALYLNETTFEKRKDFKALRDTIGRVSGALLDHFSGLALPRRLAAE
jgi:N-formylglutamate amidohydrolase